MTSVLCACVHAHTVPRGQARQFIRAHNTPPTPAPQCAKTIKEKPHNAKFCVKLFQRDSTKLLYQHLQSSHYHHSNVKNRPPMMDFLRLYDTINHPSRRDGWPLAVSRTLIDFHLFFNTLRSHGPPAALFASACDTKWLRAPSPPSLLQTDRILTGSRGSHTHTHISVFSQDISASASKWKHVAPSPLHLTCRRETHMHTCADTHTHTALLSSEKQ